MMNGRELVMSRIEKELEYLETVEIGSEAYSAAAKRLDALNAQLIELDKNDAELDVKKQQSKTDRIFQIVRTAGEVVGVVGGLVLPVIGLVCITATEKETTFTGALRDYTKLFIPKRR